MHALLGTLASVLLVVTLASAADEKPAHPSQTQRMTECNVQAAEKHLTADARKQFMSACLKGHAIPHEETSGAEKDSHSGPAPDGKHHTTQGEKMKTCNQEASAKNLHGDERKAFMSHCLKGEKKS
jgi:cell pole-organizing protein PopZ